MRYTISNRKKVLVPSGADTKRSAYPVTAYRGFKNFPSRALAREYKRTRRYAQQYLIIDTERQMIVR